MKRKRVASEPTEPEDFKFKKPKRIKKCLSEDKIKKIPSLFLSDKKNSNVLFDLLDQFNEPVTEVLAECVKALQHIFVELLKRKDMAETKDSLSDAELEYKSWLCNCYEDTWKNLSSSLAKGSQECQLQSLNSMFELLSAEAKYPLKTLKKKKKKSKFPVMRLKQILKALSLTVLNAPLYKRFLEYLQYRDVNTNIWLALMRLFEEEQEKKKTPVDERALWNILRLLLELPKPKHGSDIVLCDVKNLVPVVKVVNAAVEKVWKYMTPYKHSADNSIVTVLLMVLIDHIMPRMENTIFLTDFFMDILNRDDSALSWLALRGIYYLVSNHNIECPNIYGKLYQLFTPENIEGPYRVQFYTLADLFLSSTHLPMALVAAFARKFSYLCLFVDTPNCLALATMTVNLIIRHPALDFLVHNPESTGRENDPFDKSQKDPLKSRATESQVYEFLWLQKHYRPEIRKVANLLKKKLPTVELPLQPALDCTLNQMLSNSLKKIRKIRKRLEDEMADETAAKKKYEEKPISKEEIARRKEVIDNWFNCPVIKSIDGLMKSIVQRESQQSVEICS